MPEASNIQEIYLLSGQSLLHLKAAALPINFAVRSQIQDVVYPFPGKHHAVERRAYRCSP